MLCAAVAISILVTTAWLALVAGGIVWATAAGMSWSAALLDCRLPQHRGRRDARVVDSLQRAGAAVRGIAAPIAPRRCGDGGRAIARCSKATGQRRMPQTWGSYERSAFAVRAGCAGRAKARSAPRAHAPSLAAKCSRTFNGSRNAARAGRRWSASPPWRCSASRSRVSARGTSALGAAAQGKRRPVGLAGRAGDHGVADCASRRRARSSGMRGAARGRAAVKSTTGRCRASASPRSRAKHDWRALTASSSFRTSATKARSHRARGNGSSSRRPRTSPAG